MSKNTILLLLGSVLGIFLLWEAMVKEFPHFLFILPPPSVIFKTLWEMRTRFWFHTSITLKEMCFGFFVALMAAFPLAWAMMRFYFSRTLLQPIFIIIQCIPMFTLAPIMVVWFGWSDIAIIIPTALMIFFPLTLNIYQGLRSTPVELLEFFQANQATPWQTLIKLRLPWAVPYIFSGFRISAAIAGVSAVAGEWAGAQNGLGVMMLESRRNTDLEITFGALFCLTVISGLLYCAILYLEKIALPPRHWRFSFAKIPYLQPKKVKRRAWVLPFFLIIGTCCLLLGCKRAEQNPPTKLLLDWIPNPNHIPLYVGLEQGFFEEEGIHLDIQKIHEGGGGISYLVSKKADLLINHMPGTLKAYEKGAPLKIVGTLIKEPLCGLTYRAGLPVEKVSDLSETIFGYCIGVPDIDFLNFLLRQGEIHPKEMKNVSVDLVSAMGTKSVDFIYGGFWNIEPFQLKSWGLETNTIKIQELGVPSYYEMIILAHANTPYASADFVHHFQTALQKSIDYCKANPDEAFSCYLRYNPDRCSKTISWQREAWNTTYPLLTNDQDVDFEILKEFYLWQISQKILKQPFDFQELIQIL